MLIFIGGGGHAKVLFDIILLQNKLLYAYVDTKSQSWLDDRNIKHISEDDLLSVIAAQPELFMGFLGLDCAALQKRLQMMKDYQAKGAFFTPLIHPSASVSAKATLSVGVQVMPMAVIGSGAVIGEGAVIGSGAVVEHDAVIGAGAHIAPRAVVLGGANIGECAYIASGAVVVQNSIVPPQTFIAALTVHR